MPINRRALTLAAGLTLMAPLALAQTAAPAAAPAAAERDMRTAIVKLLPKSGAKPLTVTSPAFKDGADIPFENTQFRGNVFPGLAWSKGPAGTKSYVLIMQDPDAPTRATPVLHWTMVNIPASVTKLEAGMKAPPAGAAYGPNQRGPAQAYMGPRPPAGPKHHYHFAIFALDTTVADPGPSYDALTQAMAGHVLASGETIGLGSFDPTAPAPTPPAAPAAAPPAK